jgi:hypothetical protein
LGRLGIREGKRIIAYRWYKREGIRKWNYEGGKDRGKMESNKKRGG